MSEAAQADVVYAFGEERKSGRVAAVDQEAGGSDRRGNGPQPASPQREIACRSKKLTTETRGTEAKESNNKINPINRTQILLLILFILSKLLFCSVSLCLCGW